MSLRTSSCNFLQKEHRKTGRRASAFGCLFQNMVSLINHSRGFATFEHAHYSEA